jgi:mannose-1-phosphate guanylyltransferase
MENNYCVIMAGGVGSRFWPLSRSTRPKQFMDILGTGRTLIQQTYDRYSSLIPKENFLVVTSVSYKELVLKQLPQLEESQVLLEPLRRNTAPCVAYAAYKIKTKDPNANLVVAPSDHLILKEEEFIRQIKNGLEFVKDRDALLTLGIKPSRPETGYGYIQVKNKVKFKQLDNLYKGKTVVNFSGIQESSSGLCHQFWLLSTPICLIFHHSFQTELSYTTRKTRLILSIKLILNAREFRLITELWKKLVMCLF